MDIAVIPAYVAQGVGVALLPDRGPSPAHPGLRAVPLAGDGVSCQLAVASANTRGLPRAAEALLRLLPAHLADGPGF